MKYKYLVFNGLHNYQASVRPPKRHLSNRTVFRVNVSTRLFDEWDSGLGKWTTVHRYDAAPAEERAKFKYILFCGMGEYQTSVCPPKRELNGANSFRISDDIRLFEEWDFISKRWTTVPSSVTKRRHKK